MKKVIDILNRKGKNIIAIASSKSVHEALVIMSEKNIGSLVVSENEKLMGIITERDYARKVVLKGKISSDTPVAEIMTTNFPELYEDDTLEKCMQLMTDNNLRYLPVIKENKIIGLISIMDVVQQTILLQEETINELHQFMAGAT